MALTLAALYLPGNCVLKYFSARLLVILLFTFLQTCRLCRSIIQSVLAYAWKARFSSCANLINVVVCGTKLYVESWLARN